MDMDIFSYSALGRRSVNQDAVSVLEDGQTTLAIVADGLGGHEAGEVASGQAVVTLERLLRGKKPSETAIAEAISQANSDIRALQTPDKKMRTTIAALWLADGFAVAANVGDTRIYQFRRQNILYQSVDHSVAQMAVLLGELRPEDIRKSEDKNKLIRVLGEAKTPKADIRMLPVEPGDRFLLCSDGFWGSVTEEQMLAAMREDETAKDWLERMQDVLKTQADNSQDNHTAVALIIH